MFARKLTWLRLWGHPTRRSCRMCSAESTSFSTPAAASPAALKSREKPSKQGPIAVGSQGSTIAICWVHRLLAPPSNFRTPQKHMKTFKRPWQNQRACLMTHEWKQKLCGKTPASFAYHVVLNGTFVSHMTWTHILCCIQWWAVTCRDNYDYGHCQGSQWVAKTFWDSQHTCLANTEEKTLGVVVVFTNSELCSCKNDLERHHTPAVLSVLVRFSRPCSCRLFQALSLEQKQDSGKNQSSLEVQVAGLDVVGKCTLLNFASAALDDSKLKWTWQDFVQATWMLRTAPPCSSPVAILRSQTGVEALELDMDDRTETYSLSTAKLPNHAKPNQKHPKTNSKPPIPTTPCRTQQKVGWHLLLKYPSSYANLILHFLLSGKALLHVFGKVDAPITLNPLLRAPQRWSSPMALSEGSCECVE